MAGRNDAPRGYGYADRRGRSALEARAGEANRLKRSAFDALTGAGLPAASAGALSSALDFVPVLGDVSGGEDAFQAFRSGDNVGGAVALGATALGLVPGVGDFASKAVRSAADGAGGAARKGIRAFHGSPHDFDKFSLDKIGTGEGAQAYGHGLYFAESEGVAKSYRDQLTGDAFLIDGASFNSLRGSDAMADAWREAATKKGIPDGVIAAAERSMRLGSTMNTVVDDVSIDLMLSPKEFEAQLRSVLSKPTGRMYEVNINADPEDFLDWDLPLAGQSRAIQDRVRSVAPNAPGMASGNRLLAEAYPSNATPFTSAADRAQAQASQRLREAGIPGIKYLDQGSRAAGDGSRNYVVFDDSLVEILRKYGIGGLIAGGGAYGLTQQELEKAQADGLI